ncbi:hypothetical protein [Amphibacillus cookii]|uniref:hypothetical protein n=1 Tax=Amphibacillus cookii TaxID=767787 RepID=UPI00195C4B83|nr:hypothetical protein [Amphibacillus cookii]MBM7541582.1 peptidoglycan hydrolase CwlO-like protein [Amphibacillus cookii]
MKTKIKGLLTKSVSIFLSALLVMMTFSPVSVISAAEEYVEPEITYVTNSKEYLESLTAENEDLKKEIQSLQNKDTRLKRNPLL